MYSWGSDTDAWRGGSTYNFDSAKKDYLDDLKDDSDKDGPRSYVKSKKWDADLVDPRGKKISSDSNNPIVIGVDVTGSMDTWPGEIFDRLPLLYQTLSQYREDVEFSFGAIGDANSDDFPLQVNNFGKGLDLEKHIKALYPEGNGGGQISETYELFGYFMLEHCDVPKATSPFLFIFGDEKFYPEVSEAHIKHYIGDEVQSSVDSTNMWQKLNQKFNVYFLQKSYGWGGDSSLDREIKNYWAKAIGEQKVIDLPSKERAIDIAMGIVAKHWGKFGDFKENLDARHDSKNLKDSVYHSIRYVSNADSSKSVLNKSTTASESLSKLYKDAKR